MFGSGMLIFFALPAVFGVTLAGISLILRLCEWSWEKKAGSMGSTGLLLVSALFWLPLVLYLVWKAMEKAI